MQVYDDLKPDTLLLYLIQLCKNGDIKFSPSLIASFNLERVDKIEALIQIFRIPEKFSTQFKAICVLATDPEYHPPKTSNNIDCRRINIGKLLDDIIRKNGNLFISDNCKLDRHIISSIVEEIRLNSVSNLVVHDSHASSRYELQNKRVDNSYFIHNLFMLLRDSLS